ncbi:MAG: sterol desaturase family protein [Alphaproteobacteria bacterium]
MVDVVSILLVYKGVIVAAWLAALFLGERLLPADDNGRGWFGDWRRLGVNLVLWLVTAGISFLVVVPLSAWAAAHPLWLRPAWWGGLGGLALDLLIMDFWIYWWHRANHRIPFLWRFHEIHHLDEYLDTSTALRFHFGEVLVSALVRGAVIVALGMPIASVLVFEILIQIGSIFHHSNLRLPRTAERALSWLIITPSLHWVHHHKIRRDTDSTYGTVLSVWDRLFRSRGVTARHAGMPIGVEGQDEKSLPELFVRPFAINRSERQATKD